MSLLISQAMGISPFILVMAALAMMLMTILFIFVGYRKAKQGQALVRTGFGHPQVSFNGLFALPLLHKVETVDVTLKHLVINSFDKQEFLTEDGQALEINADFNLRVNPVSFDVLEAVMAFGGAKKLQDETRLIGAYR